MFSRLVASAGVRSPFRQPPVVVGSVAVHAALLAGMVWASSPDRSAISADQTVDEEVTYIDIGDALPPPEVVVEEPAAEPAASPPPAAAPPAAAPAARAAASPGPTRPAQPRPSAVAAPSAPTEMSSEPAGFQELRAPGDVVGIPAPNPSLAPVRSGDFGGRGQVGGTGDGTPASDAGSGRIGTGDGTGSGTGSGTGTGAGTGTGTGTGDGPPTGTFSQNLVDRRAELINRGDVVRVLQRLYPRALRESGTEGSVQVQFVVTPEGRVDMSTVQIQASTNDEFAAATRKALEEFRFRPARKGDHNVRMLTVLPVQWKLSN
jgi:periplasmic protein TonB